MPESAKNIQGVQQQTVGNGMSDSAWQAKIKIKSMEITMEASFCSY